MSDASAVVRSRVFLWAVASLVVFAGAELGAQSGIALEIIGFGLVFAASKERWTVRAVIAVAVLPFAFAAQVPAWALVFAMVAVVLPAARRHETVHRDFSPLQRHLDRARRRGEGAQVLAVRATSPTTPSTQAVQDTFRITDSLAFQPVRSGYELFAVLDQHKLERPGVERRVRERLPGEVVIGWAAFPADGYNLDALLERSTAEIRAAKHRPTPGDPGANPQANSSAGSLPERPATGRATDAFAESDSTPAEET